MKIKRLNKLLKIVDKHQERLERVHSLLEDTSIVINPTTRASIVTQILDLTTNTTAVLCSELIPTTSPYHGELETLNYTFSPQDLDEELESLYLEDEMDDEDELDDDGEY